VLGIIEPHFWSRFCEAVDLPELLEDQWPTGAAAARQAERLRSLFLERTQEQWLAFLAPADIPFSPVKTLAEAMRDPQLKHRNMFFQMEHPTVGTIPQLGFPIKLSETPCTSYAPPPALGQHNEEVLRLVGYSGADLEGLKESNVV
jgi:crotonobetainyl-CoA:carnitine CoA-transferase CaiB-like acyl-CoA transferase